MRSSLKMVVVALVAVGGSLVGAIPGGGAEQPQMNSVQVRKAVTGDAPPGTIFVVKIVCENVQGPAAAALPFEEEVRFDEEGVFLTPAEFALPAHSRCNVTETADGGASSTSYGCSIRHKAMNDEPPFEGNCTGDNQVTFGNVIDDRATLTVFNTFPLGRPAEEPLAEEAPVAPVPQAVQAAPAFTG